MIPLPSKMFSFVNFVKNGLFPTVRADDEIEAPQEVLAVRTFAAYIQHFHLSVSVMTDD